MGTVILAIVLLLATTASGADDDLHIFALPVGQGDATIIQCPAPKGKMEIEGEGELVIIDIGSSSAQKTKDEKGFMRIADVKKFIGDTGNHVENVFLTHPDKDHYNFIAAASKFMDDKTTIYHTHLLTEYNNCWKINDDGTPNEQKFTLEQVIGDIKPSHPNVKHVGKVDCSKSEKKDIDICGGDATITVLASELGGGQCSDKNSDSFVLQLNYGGKKSLFVGDIEGGAIATIAKCNIKSDVLCLSHHGSVNNHANYNGFLKAVNPKYAFSSSDPCHATWTHPSCYISSWFTFMGTALFHVKRPYMCRWPNEPDDTRDIYYNEEYNGPCYGTTTTEDCKTFQHWILDFKISTIISFITVYMRDPTSMKIIYKNP